MAPQFGGGRSTLQHGYRATPAFKTPAEPGDAVTESASHQGMIGLRPPPASANTKPLAGRTHNAPAVTFTPVGVRCGSVAQERPNNRPHPSFSPSGNRTGSLFSRSKSTGASLPLEFASKLFLPRIRFFGGWRELLWGHTRLIYGRTFRSAPKTATETNPASSPKSA